MRAITKVGQQDLLVVAQYKCSTLSGPEAVIKRSETACGATPRENSAAMAATATTTVGSSALVNLCVLCVSASSRRPQSDRVTLVRRASAERNPVGGWGEGV